MKEPSEINVLIACEESQAVCVEFRKLGFNAYSNDIQECSGVYPEWHIKEDIVILLSKFRFYTMDRKEHFVNNWDLIIAHPPCTRLCLSGVRWLHERNLWDEMYAACEFFNIFQSYAKNNNIPVCIENPIPHKYAKKYIGKYSQIIHPHMFGHKEQKRTGLWLYNLPLLKPTNNVYDEMMLLPVKERTRIHWLGSKKSKERSITYNGIAKAFASQYGSFLLNGSKIEKQNIIDFIEITN